MSHEPPLLERVRTGSPVPRALFRNIYFPFLTRILLNLGYRAGEAETLLEIFERAVFGESECFVYDTSRGVFSDFMYGILTQCLTELPAAPDRMKLTPELWKSEWKKHVLDQALQKLRQEEKPGEYSAFEFHVLDGKSARETAVMCSMLPEMVYLVKTRLMRRLRVLMKEFSAEAV